jgi:ferric-dicitrate binding protein FerR (iron transport regulator)
MSKVQDYFDGRMSADEEKEFRRFLLSHASDPELEGQMLEIFNSLETNDSEDTDGKFIHLISQLGMEGKLHMRKGFKSFLRWSARAIAILAIPLLIAGILMLYMQKPAEWIEKTVPEGQTESLILSDGSSLVLNSGSHIIFPNRFQGKERKVFLDGEVIADISKDSDHPFVIQSGELNVLVHGTKFDFKSYSSSECSELLLINGSVSFSVNSNGSERVLHMTPGDMVQYDRKTGKLQLERFQPSTYKSFNENRSLHFFNLKLRDIAKDLEHTFGTRIIIMDEGLAETRYFAYFKNNETLEQILKAIADNNKDMAFRQQNGVVYIMKK